MPPAMPKSPRTDAAEFELHHTQAGAYMRKCAGGGWVESVFARGLESENAKLARWIISADGAKTRSFRAGMKRRPEGVVSPGRAGSRYSA
jgi:hypothetical protein